VRELAEIVGAAALSGTDQLYLLFETEFEHRVVDQGRREARSLDETFARCLDVLRVLPRRELSMLPVDLLEDLFKDPLEDPFESSEVREPRVLDERAGGG
jgi:V/A-type H+-transporting ATPase subunit B